ncbi:hypothetical protein JCM17961_23600 [Endothiovibrio diazotrophicus]
MVTDLSRFSGKILGEKSAGLSDAISFLSGKYKEIEFVSVVIGKGDDLRSVRDKVKRIVERGNIVLVLGSDNSSVFAELGKVYPRNVPVISMVGTIDLLVKSGLHVFTTSSTTIEKAKQVLWLAGLNGYGKIVHIYENKNPYGEEIVSLLRGKVDVVNYSGGGVGDCSGVLVITDSPSYLVNMKSVGCDAYSYRGVDYSLRAKNKIFSSSSRIPGVRSIGKSSYYSSSYNSIVERVVSSFRDIDDLLVSPLLARDVISSLEKMDEGDPYIGKYSIAYGRIGSSHAYYNRYVDLGYFKKYITRLDNQYLLFESQMPTQNVSLDKIPTVFIDIKIKQYDIDGIQSKRASLEMYFSMYSIDDDVGIDDFALPMISKDDMVFSLVKSESYMNDGVRFYNKMYKLSVVLGIDSDLFMFPFDSQILRIVFEPANFSKKPFFIQPMAGVTSPVPVQDPNWRIVGVEGISLSNNISVTPSRSVRKKGEIVSVPQVGFDVNIERKHGISTLLKFMGPVLLILSLVLISSFGLRRDHFSEKNSIMVSGLLGIISIYFIFSVIIDIEQFVVIDGLFVFSILFTISVLALEIFLTGKGESGRYYFGRLVSFIKPAND